MTIWGFEGVALPKGLQHLHVARLETIRTENTEEEEKEIEWFWGLKNTLQESQ